MLLKLAEHVAIRFALDSYEKGELRVNAVKQLLDRMNTEIEALRKILGTQEEMMAHAGSQCSRTRSCWIRSSGSRCRKKTRKKC